MNYVSDSTAPVFVSYNVNENYNSMKQLLDNISEVTGLSIAEIREHKRNREKVIARSLFCYIARVHFHINELAIGKYLILNRTTVYHGIGFVKLSFTNKDELSRKIAIFYNQIMGKYINL
jgi:chromosomal replication initiation ATPase DnaA